MFLALDYYCFILELNNFWANNFGQINFIHGAIT